MKPSSEWRTAVLAHLNESAIAKRFTSIVGKHVKVAVADSTYAEIHYATQTRGSCEEHQRRRTLAVLPKRSELTNSQDCKHHHTSCPVFERQLSKAAKK